MNLKIKIVMKKLLLAIGCFVGVGVQYSNAQLSIEERMRPEYRLTPEQQMANLQPSSTSTVLSLEDEISALENQLVRIEEAMNEIEQNETSADLAYNEDYIKLAQAQENTSASIRRKKQELEKRKEVSN